MRPARVTLILCCVLLAGLAGGFILFVNRLARGEFRAETMPVADGIVALTGGSDRIADAAQLLANGRGRRLLITGVNEKTTAEEIAFFEPRLKPLLECCVDLDRRALNTIGNAFQATRWSRDKGFSSLLVVTSSYHMPRTLAELGDIAPELRLIPFPVVSTRVKPESWWRDAQTAKLLGFEYIKWLAVRARIALGLPTPRSREANPRRDQDARPSPT